MDVKDTAYFDSLLQLHKAYRISGFRCEQTGLWERTLDNPTSLIFGKFIHLEEVPTEDFPVSPDTMNLQQGLMSGMQYSQVVSKLLAGLTHMEMPLQTEPIKELSYSKSKHIIHLDSGNTISLTLWHDMAVNFNLQEYKALERPVVIAVSSCWVRRFHRLQLSGTSATHYYLNPNIPETLHIRQVYCFKAIINDGTATMSVTCFSDNTNTLIRECHDVLAELANKDPYEFPSALRDLEGTTHVFQFHFDSGSSSRRRDLVLDRVFETPALPLPAPPPQIIPSETPIEEQPRTTQVSEPPLPLSTLPLQTTTQVTDQKSSNETEETKEPESTPPATPETVKPVKGNQETNLPKTSASKSLFKTETEADTSKGTKKPKHHK
ncbi:DNA helicase [Tanacetum coccineum]|uniref:DNA helicase n=1 Tax=Tanacetum coccineum TaxID=301880 RepID=A0ABQ5DC50_9ASTR